MQINTAGWFREQEVRLSTRPDEVGSKAQAGVILAIEDDSEDLELLRIALAQANFPSTLVSVPFARDAVKYLCRIGECADQTRFPRPALVVLDLSLPGMSEMDFLTWASGEPNVPPIVVLTYVVLTYSDLNEDRRLAAGLGAKAYFLKSLDLKQTAGILETLSNLIAQPLIPPGPI